MDPYTSGRYAEANPDWHEADAEHKARVLGDLIGYLGLEPRSVADVGCGTGAVLRHLKAQLDDRLGDTAWEGWDIASAPIARARRHEGERLLYVAEDFLASERRVDLLLAVDVIEHVPDDLAFLQALRSRADWFLFRIPLDLSALDVLRPKRLLEARRRFGHRHQYSREIALELLANAGYRVESVSYDRVPPARDTSRRRAIDLGRRALFSVWPHRTVRLVGGWSLVVCCRPT